MKIVLATDGSKGSQRAAKWLQDWPGRPASCEIVVVHVVKPLAYWFVPLPGSAPVRASTAAMEQIGERAREDGQALVDRIAEELAGVCTARGVLAEGHPQDELIKLAKAEKADLIVMGRRGLGPVGGIVMGSVTQRVLHQSKVPVMVVP